MTAVPNVEGWGEGLTVWGSGIPGQDAQTDEKWLHSSARRVENNHSYVGLGPPGSRQSRIWLHSNNVPSPTHPHPQPSPLSSNPQASGSLEGRCEEGK